MVRAPARLPDRGAFIIPAGSKGLDGCAVVGRCLRDPVKADGPAQTEWRSVMAFYSRTQITILFATTGRQYMARHRHATGRVHR